MHPDRHEFLEAARLQVGSAYTAGAAWIGAPWAFLRFRYGCRIVGSADFRHVLFDMIEPTTFFPNPQTVLLRPENQRWQTQPEFEMS